MLLKFDMFKVAAVLSEYMEHGCIPGAVDGYEDDSSDYEVTCILTAYFVAAETGDPIDASVIDK